MVFSCYTCGTLNDTLISSSVTTIDTTSTSSGSDNYHPLKQRSQNYLFLRPSSKTDCDFPAKDSNNNDKSMRGSLRASVSRRSSADRHMMSPMPPRSRSTERWKEPVIPLDDEDDIVDNGSIVASGENGLKTAKYLSSHHVRAMSDPYDAQEDIQSDVEEFQDGEQRRRRRQSGLKNVVPTLPRYPVASTRNKNCWSEPPVSLFEVRGIHYFDDKKKINSGPYLLRARGCDLLLADEKTAIKAEDRSDALLEGRLRREPTLMINLRLPWGFMIFYFEIPKKLVPYVSRNKKAIDKSLSTSEQVAAAWFQGDTNYRNERLKLIPFVAEGPWVVRNMVGGRPAIIGKKLPVKYTLLEEGGAPLLCATLDIGNSSAAAKRIVSVCRRYMSSLTVDMGFCIQGETPEELPEQMLGSIRIYGPDPLKAMHLY